MGRLFIPSEKTISGPWLLSHENLETLDNMFTEVNSKLTEALTKFIEKTAKQQEEEGEKKLGIEQRISRLRDKYSHRSKSVRVDFADGSAYGKATDIKGVINYVDTHPSQSCQELTIKTRVGNSENEFELAVLSDGDLAYSIHCIDEDIQQEVKTIIDKWIRNNQPKKALSIWCNAIVGIIWFVGGFTLFITSFLLADETIETNTSEKYKSQLKKEATELISSGISDSNLTQAVSLVLKIQSDYVPKDIKKETIRVSNQPARTIFTITLILFIASLIRPQTVIGIGKNRTKYNRYKFYIVATSFLLLTAIATEISYLQGWLFH